MHPTLASQVLDDSLVGLHLLMRYRLSWKEREEGATTWTTRSKHYWFIGKVTTSYNYAMHAGVAPPATATAGASTAIVITATATDAIATVQT